MKTSILKANERASDDLWKQFQALNVEKEWKESGIEFRKKEITEHDGQELKPGSFEIRYTKMIDGIRKGRTVFLFLKKQDCNLIQWDEKYITI